MNDIPATPQRGPYIPKAHIDALMAAAVFTDSKMGDKTTVVCCRLPNGFEITETSGCVDPANYDHALGVSVCKRRMVDKLWLLEGYRLQCELAGAASAFHHALVPTREESVAWVARVAHEINRAYCLALGDTSQPEWEAAPSWQRASAIHGVEFHLANPNAWPWASHDSWSRQKIADGWVHGEVKDAEKKTHPCLVPFNDLPVEQQAKDYLFRAVVHALRDEV